MQEFKTLKTIGMGLIIIGSIASFICAFITVILLYLIWTGEELEMETFFNFAHITVIAVSYLIAGIMAVKACKKTDKIESCVQIGRFMIAFSAISLFSISYNIKLVIIILAVPFLYTYTVTQLKKHIKQQEESQAEELIED